MPKMTMVQAIIQGVVMAIDQEGFKVVSLSNNYAFIIDLGGPVLVQPGVVNIPPQLEMFLNNLQGVAEPVQPVQRRQNRYRD